MSMPPDDIKSRWTSVVDAVSAFAFVSIALAIAGVLPNSCYLNTRDEGRFADHRIGMFGWHFCYSDRTVAGATPPVLEQVVWPLLPVYAHHPMQSNMAGYTLLAVPLWPLLVLTGWTPVPRAYRLLKDRWLMWANSGADPRRGFELVISATVADPAAEPLGSEGLIPPAPASRTPGSTSSAPRR
jgi:hypothetical protein